MTALRWIAVLCSDYTGHAHYVELVFRWQIIFDHLLLDYFCVKSKFNQKVKKFLYKMGVGFNPYTVCHLKSNTLHVPCVALGFLPVFYLLRLVFVDVSQNTQFHVLDRKLSSYSSFQIEYHFT